MGTVGTRSEWRNIHSLWELDRIEFSQQPNQNVAELVIFNNVPRLEILNLSSNSLQLVEFELRQFEEFENIGSFTKLVYKFGTERVGYTEQAHDGIYGVQDPFYWKSLAVFL